MTVGELIDRLRAFGRDRMVYVPDYTDGTVQLVTQVSDLPHLNVPKGIAIPDDVVLLPLSLANAEDTDL